MTFLKRLKLGSSRNGSSQSLATECLPAPKYAITSSYPSVVARSLSSTISKTSAWNGWKKKAKVLPFG